MKALRTILGLATIGLIIYLINQGEEQLPPHLAGTDGRPPAEKPGGNRTQPVDRQPLTISGGLQVTPRPDQTILAGTVLTPEERAAGALVEWIIQRPGPQIRGFVLVKARTDRQGCFSLVVPPGSSGTLRITHQGYPALLRALPETPPVGQILDLGLLKLLPGIRLLVQVLDRVEGNSLGDALITLDRPPLHPEIGTPRLQVRTTGRGLARMGPVSPGRWQFSVAAAGHSTWSEVLTITEDPTQRRTVYLARGPGLQGLVLAADDHPLAAAAVTATPMLAGSGDHRGVLTCRTDRLGRFDLAGLEEGRWSLSAAGPAHATTLPLVVECPATDTVTIHTARLPVLAGRVLDPTGTPLAGARVALAGRAGPMGTGWVVHGAVDPVTTDRTGRWRLALTGHPGRGQWVVAAWAADMLPALSPTLDLDQTTPAGNLDLTLARGATLQGRVSPTLDTRVSLVGSGSLPCPPFLSSQPPVRVTVGEDGSWRLHPVAPGPCTLLFQARGHWSKKLHLVVEEGKTRTVPPVTLLPGVVVSGMLHGPDGRPEPGGLVCLQETNESQPIKTIAGPDGRFVLPPVRPGKYVIKACRRDAGPLEAPLQYAASSRDLVLEGRFHQIREPLRIGRP